MAESIIPEYINMTLERRSQDGVELYVDRKTMLAFASTKGLARICNVTPRAIREYFKGYQITAISAEIPTNKGMQRGYLWSHQHVKKAILHYNLDLAERIMDCGTNVFLLGLAGIKVTAQEDSSPSVFSLLTATRRDPMPWECMFSSSWIFWAQKTTQWDWNHSCMSHFLNWTVYDYFPDVVTAELRTLARNESGVRVRKMHQHLSPEARDLMESHASTVLDLMKSANGNEDLFGLLMKNRFGEYRKPKLIPTTQIPLFEIKQSLIFEIKPEASVEAK